MNADVTRTGIDPPRVLISNFGNHQTPKPRRPAERLSVDGILLQPEALREHAQGEQRVGFHIAGSEAPWFRAQPEQPFAPAALNPAWRLPDAARVKIERRTHADQHARFQFTPVARHEFLL